MGSVLWCSRNLLWTLMNNVWSTTTTIAQRNKISVLSIATLYRHHRVRLFIKHPVSTYSRARVDCIDSTRNYAKKRFLRSSVENNKTNMALFPRSTIITAANLSTWIMQWALNSFVSNRIISLPTNYIAAAHTPSVGSSTDGESRSSNLMSTLCQV